MTWDKEAKKKKNQQPSFKEMVTLHIMQNYILDMLFGPRDSFSGSTSSGHWGYCHEQ